METTAIRNKLHQYIDTSDDKLLKLMYALARGYNEENEGDISHEFIEKDIARYETLHINRIKGESKTHDWDEAKKIITRK